MPHALSLPIFIFFKDKMDKICFDWGEATLYIYLFIYGEKTKEYLKENMHNFWDKDWWPPKSPDLNFLECSFLAYMEQMACKKLYPSVDDLRATITRTWGKNEKGTCEEGVPELPSRAEEHYHPKLWNYWLICKRDY